MIYNKLGHSGLAVSAVSIGPWNTITRNLDVNYAKSLIHYAFEQGINYFDNAERHENGEAEFIMGKALADLPRQQIVVGTKLFWGGNSINEVGLSRKHIIEGLHGSLKRLDLDYLDITLCHRDDTTVSVREIASTFDLLIKQGKTLYWGISEWSAQRILDLIACCHEFGYEPPVCVQAQYHMLSRERVEKEYAPIFKQHGLGLMANSPLFFGILSGKYLDSIPQNSRLAQDPRLMPNNLQNINAFVGILKEIATQINVSCVQLAMAWVLNKPFVNTALTGFKHPDQLDEILNAINLLNSDLTNAFQKVEHAFAYVEESCAYV